MSSFKSLLNEIHACTICHNHLPLGPRPVLQFHPKAKILVAGQAPGRKVHQTGIPFDDASGNRLRQWLGISNEIFYDPEHIAILPMAFCYPGSVKSGDLPPRPECAPAWRKELLDKLENLKITLVIGKYAQDYHLDTPSRSLTEVVKAWSDYWPALVPLPHPSPRNNIWLFKNLWFVEELLPSLKNRISEILSTNPG